MHAYIHTYIHKGIHTEMHTCIHACMQTYIHTYRSATIEKANNKTITKLTSEKVEYIPHAACQAKNYVVAVVIFLSICCSSGLSLLLLPCCCLLLLLSVVVIIICLFICLYLFVCVGLFIACLLGVLLLLLFICLLFVCFLYLFASLFVYLFVWLFVCCLVASSLFVCLCLFVGISYLDCFLLLSLFGVIAASPHFFFLWNSRAPPYPNPHWPSKIGALGPLNENKCAHHRKNVLIIGILRGFYLFSPVGVRLVSLNQGAAKGGRRSFSFGRFLVTFSDACVAFLSLLCQTPFAAGWLKTHHFKAFRTDFNRTLTGSG